MYKLTLLMGLMSSAVAEQFTTTLLLVGFDTQPIDASIVASDATATTFALTCPPTVDSTDCGIPPGFTITQGPSTMHYAYTWPGDELSQSNDVGCTITSDHGTCSAIITGELETGTGIATSSTAIAFSNSGVDIGAQAVTVTAGGSAAPGSSASPSNSAASTTASAPTQTGSSSSGGSSTGSPSSTGPSSTSSTSTSTNAGMPMVTGRASWVVGGAAAVVAYAAM